MPKIMIIGGVARSLLNFRGDLIDEWLSMDYEVVALAAQATDDIKQKLFAKGINYQAIPLERDGINPFKDIKALYRIYSTIKMERPSYLFLYTVKPVIYASTAARFFPQIKVCSMITGLGYVFSGKSVKQNVLSKIIRLFYRYALQKNDLILFQNPDDLNLFNQLELISKNQKTVLVNGSGVNITHFYFSKIKRQSKFVFLLIARMLKSKGIADFVQAAELIKSKYEQVSFKLLGPLSDGPDGIDRSLLESWTDKGLVEYLGRTSDVRPYIEDCSVYVLPSYREGMPRSVLEAMAMGRPIITTDAPGCRETVEEGVNGFLVPIRDSKALAAAMERFIEKPELVSKMGRESRQIAEEKYDVRKVNKVILEAMGLSQSI